MMKFIVLLSIALPAAVMANSAGSDTNPIEKVIGLIKDLKAKAIAEGKEEAVAFQKFEYWCSTSLSELKDAISDEKESIEELTDSIAGLDKKIEGLGKDIDNLNQDIADLQASAKAAKDNRKEEADLYSKVNKDLQSTIDAVDGCISALEGAESKTESKMLLAQHRAKVVLSLIGVKATEEQKRVLQEFAQRPDQLAEGDLAKHTDKYDFKSENVIELLKELKTKFEDDQLAATKAETAAINAYDLSKQARDASIAAAEKSAKKKGVEKAEAERNRADDKKAKKSTEDDLAADSKSKNDTEDSCRIKKGEWERRSETRSNEVEAMTQAIKILAKSSGVRTEAPGNPVPPPSPASFLQIAGDSSDPKMKAVALLKQTAQEEHSRALERLAVEVAAHLNGPFDQVNNMIQKMIFRLMDEQKQEDEHKLWCDKEIEKTKTMQDDKNEKISDLKAEIKVENGEVAKLTNEIAAATKMINDIDTFVKEATEIRNTGKKENALAIKDAQQAQNSLSDAIAVLTAFYKKSGEIAKEPWEFIQKPVNLPKNPATWDSGYTGVSDPDKQPGGIISVLEGVNADFSKMESETKSQEAQDQEEYEAAMKDNSIEKAGREQEVKMKTAEKARRNDKIASLSSTKKNTEGELEKTDQYYEDLKPACMNGDSSYDDRKAARAKEITALKEAQVILQDAFKEKKLFLQIKKH